MSLVVASQHYEVPIDPAELQATFRNAGDWLERGPELAALFHEPRGSLAESFAFLSQLDGVQDRLFPGYAYFEASLDGRVLTEKDVLRGALERRKLAALEEYVREGRKALENAVSAVPLTDPSRGVAVAVEAALLDAVHLASVKLALKTKRLPLTNHDLFVRHDESLALHERFSSGLSDIPLEEYFQPFCAECGFTAEEVRIAEFLIAQHRALMERAREGLNDDRMIEDFVQLCGRDEPLMRSLFVFTYADHSGWESEKSDPSRWFNIREIYRKALMRFRGGSGAERSLAALGFSAEQLDVLNDFGRDFFDGGYGRFANKFGAHLVRLVEEPETSGPRVTLLNDGTSMIIGVAAQDYRGLAATITGALWHNQIDLRQAHLFSATQHSLAFDFFHIASREKPVGSEQTRMIEQAIKERRYIADEDAAQLPRISGDLSLKEWRPGLYCLRFETAQQSSGLVYALAYKVFRHLRGNIFGLTAHAIRGRAYVSVYHSLPGDLPLEEAQRIAADRIGA